MFFRRFGDDVAQVSHDSREFSSMKFFVAIDKGAEGGFWKYFGQVWGENLIETFKVSIVQTSSLKT